MKRWIIALLILAMIALIAYGVAMVNAFNAIHQASIELAKPEVVHFTKSAGKQTNVTPQAESVSESANVPSSANTAVKTPQTKPYEAAQGAPTEKPVSTSVKPKCDQAYIDEWQSQIDERNDLIEAKQLKDYETDFVMRTQILENGLAEYKKGCE